MLALIKKIICSFINGCDGKIRKISTDEYSLLKYHKIDILLYDMTDSFILDNHDKNDLLNRKKNNEEKNITYINEIIKINKILKSYKIDYVLLKGGALILDCYTKIYSRMFHDVDILVSSNNISTVENILKDIDYIQGNIVGDDIEPVKRTETIFQRLHTHEICSMVKKHLNGQFTRIDVNFKFMWQEFSHIDLPFNTILQHIKLIGTENEKIPILNNDLQFVHLSIHFYNEAFYFVLDNNFTPYRDPRELRLFRLIDIILLISKRTINVYNAYKLSLDLNSIHKIEFVLSLIALIMGREFVALFFSYFNIQDDVPNYFFTKNGQKIDWPISIYERLFDLSSRAEIINSFSMEGII